VVSIKDAIEPAFCRAVRTGQGVEAVVGVFRVVDLAEDDCAFFAGVLGDLTERFYQGALHDVDANLLITLKLQFVESADATANKNACAEMMNNSWMCSATSVPNNEYHGIIRCGRCGL
jgi:hypothetical protein